MDTNTPSTSLKNKIDYISGKLDSHIRSFQSSAIWYRRVYFYTSIATLVFSALITIIVGWKPDLHTDVKTENLVLILGALITVISGLGMFFSPKDSWLIYASSLNRLRALKAKIEFMQTDPVAFEQNDKRRHDLYDEFQGIFDSHNNAWLRLRASATPAAQKRVDHP